MTRPNSLFPKGLYVYDIETLNNFFSVVFMSDTETHVFYIHDLDNRRARIDCWNRLKQFMSRVKLLVGYNNLHFDRPVLDYVLKSHTTANAVYRFAQKIIDGHRHNTEILFNVRELDLYKMNHFDSDAKRTSLKHLQFAMKYENVMDMPIHHSTSISRKQVDTVIEYNINDVKSTMEFYIKCKRGIEIRKIIGDKYDLDLTNDSEPTISKKVFGSILSKNLDIELDALYQMRTPRDIIHIKDVILPYVEFKSPEFNFVLDYFKSMSISVLKGAFENIDVTNADRSYLNPKRLKIKRKGKDATVLSKSLHTMFDGEEYVYGTGGIHSKIEGLIVIPEDDEVILDLDVTSYYPNLVIRNKLRPEHLPESFCDVYEGIFEERKLYPKSDPSNYLLKIILNATYGLSNNEYSYLYDPQLTCQITINGQLLLSMLIERVVLETGSRCFAANTDGASFVVKKSNLDQVFKIAREWEELTKLNLEHETYDKMFFRDVNNYIWVKGDKYKLKGVFEPLESKGWHKDFSQPIVNKAVVDYYTKGVSYKDTIDNHTDILDFCKEVKVTGTDKLVSRRMSKGTILENPENKLTRYYVSKSGVSLTKIMSPLDKVSDLDREKRKGQVNVFDYIPDVKIDPKNRETSIEAGHTCTVYNVHKEQDISQYDVNYDYYYNECKKLIKSVERGKTKKEKKNNEKSNSNSKYKQQSIF